MRYREILESFFDQQHVSNEFFDGDVIIYKNPSTTQFNKLYMANKGARGFFDIENVYVWFEPVLHSDIDTVSEHSILWEFTPPHVLIGINYEVDNVPQDDFVKWATSNRRLAPLLRGRRLEFRNKQF